MAEALDSAQHPSQKICSKYGTLLNPYKVEIRNHEKQAMVFRYLVYKGLETAFMGMLTRGQRISTIDEIPGIDNPLVQKANLPVELALRQGWELAIEGQAEKSAWFYFAGEPETLFFRNATGDVTHSYSRSSGKTESFKKSSVSGFVDERIKSQEVYERALDEGRAI